MRRQMEPLMQNKNFLPQNQLNYNKISAISFAYSAVAEDIESLKSFCEPISGINRPQIQFLPAPVPALFYDLAAAAAAANNNSQSNNNCYNNINITQHPPPRPSLLCPQEDTTTPPTYYNYNHNYIHQHQLQQQQQLHHQQQQQAHYNPFLTHPQPQHLNHLPQPVGPHLPHLFSNKPFGCSASSYLGGSTGFAGLGLGGLGGALTGGAGAGYTPLGRSYRYYKHHSTGGLGHSSYNGYYSLSFGESYYPYTHSPGGGLGAGGSSGGLAPLGGSGNYFGRISPAAAHTGPLLATSAAETRTSLLKLASPTAQASTLAPPPPPPLLPPLDDDLQVSTEPYLSTYSSRPIDYIPSPPASLRSETYAYRPRRRAPETGRYSATGYYTRQRARGFSPIIDCDRYLDREFVGRSRLRANSLQSHCDLGLSPFGAIDRLSPIPRHSSSPRQQREKYLSPGGSPKYGSKTSSTAQGPHHLESQYHSQAYNASSQNISALPPPTDTAAEIRRHISRPISDRPTAKRTIEQFRQQEEAEKEQGEEEALQTAEPGAENTNSKRISINHPTTTTPHNNHSNTNSSNITNTTLQISRKHRAQQRLSQAVPHDP
uniref:Uncharacterized protein n=1 Tax=Stomoxys calcitrans TaxID=35570 RepID=A0A1I8NQC0_STOCA